MRSLSIALLDLKRLGRSHFTRLALVVVCLLPLLYSFLYLDAFWDPYNHLDKMKVAVVNRDVPNTTDGQTVNAGANLVAKLKNDHNVGWVFTNAADAQAGLSSGTYRLAVIIPADFSSQLVQETKDPANEPVQKAKLEFYSNPSNNFLADQIGNKLASELENQLSGQIDSRFFDQIFGNLSDMKQNLAKAAGGASDLAGGIQRAQTGSQQVASNLKNAAAGSSELVDGLQKLSNGTTGAVAGSAQVAGGAQALLNGADTIQIGLTKVQTGTSELANGSQQLNQGLNTANSQLQSAAVGARKVQAGSQDAFTGAQKLQAGINQLNDGAGSLQTGISGLGGGLTQLKSRFDDSTTGVPRLISGMQQLDGGVGQVQQGVQTANNGIVAAKNGLGNVTSGLGQVKTGLSQNGSNLDNAVNFLNKSLESNPSLANDPNFQQALTLVKDADQTVSTQLSPGLSASISGLDSVNNGLSAVSSGLVNQDNSVDTATVYGGLTSLHTGLTSTDPQNPGLITGSQQLLQQMDGGLQQLIDGAGQAADGVNSLKNGLANASTGGDGLSQGLHTLTVGTAQLADGLTAGSAGFPMLLEGSNRLDQGLQTLSTGEQSLGHGFATFQTKLGDLSTGTGQLAAGIGRLSNGVNTATSGAVSLNNGLNQLYSGSKDLNSGLGKLAGGSGELKSGLQDGVNDIQKQLPYNRLSVADTMGQPVKLDKIQTNPVTNYGTGLAPYFISLSLWVGALMLFFLVNAREPGILAAGASRFDLVFGKFLTLGLLGLLQAVVSSVVLIYVLGLKPEHLVQFYAFNILLSWTFIAIIQLLVQTMDMAGRFLAIVLLMLQLTSSAGTFPLELVPNFFRDIDPYLPMTYGITGLRQIIAGNANIGLGTSVLILIIFAAGAFALSVLLTSNRVSVGDLHPAKGSTLSEA